MRGAAAVAAPEASGSGSGAGQRRHASGEVALLEAFVGGDPDARQLGSLPEVVDVPARAGRSAQVVAETDVEASLGAPDVRVGARSEEELPQAAHLQPELRPHAEHEHVRAARPRYAPSIRTPGGWWVAGLPRRAREVPPPARSLAAVHSTMRVAYMPCW